VGLNAFPTGAASAGSFPGAPRGLATAKASG